jgi:hypothetical protein
LDVVGAPVAVYPVIDAPPVPDGAVHETTDWPFAPAVAEMPVGASGTVEGTAAADALEAVPVPDAFVAVTLNVYEVPFARPLTVQVLAEVVQVNDPGVEVTVYPVIAAPPFEDGAVQDTTDWPFALELAETEVGAPGTVDGVAAADAAEALLVPIGFVAVTLNVYEVPFVSPVTTHLRPLSLVLHLKLPGVDVTVEFVTAVPPFDVRFQETVDWPFSLLVADTPLGASGAVLAIAYTGASSSAAAYTCGMVRAVGIDSV